MKNTLHFLNVKQGDCTWIQHHNGHNSIVDVFNASFPEEKLLKASSAQVLETLSGVKGNFGQKDYPVNPIEYLKDFEVYSVFRFVLTHPDMDHMGGIKDFFQAFSPTNFWDTENKKTMGSFDGSPYSKEDWDFYKKLRAGSDVDPKRLTLYSGSKGQYFNRDENNQPDGDSLYILAPTPELMKEAVENDDYNDASYVLLYVAPNGAKVVLAGDSHDKTWEHILDKYSTWVSDVDLLLAPHHGRKSGRNYDFLDHLKPKLTFFGNANHEHLAYGAWNSRGLEKFTNNQGNCLIAEFVSGSTRIYCTYKKFAEAYCEENGQQTYESKSHKAWYLKTI